MLQKILVCLVILVTVLAFCGDGQKLKRVARRVRELEKEQKMQCKCPNSTDWIHNSTLGTCYHFMKITYKWFRAQQQCMMIGATLAMIESQAENDFLSNYIEAGNAPYKVYWLGASDLSDTELVWSAPGYFGVPVSQSSYTNFKTGAPQGSNMQRMCLAMDGNAGMNAEWDDVNCESTNFFGICKRCA